VIKINWFLKVKFPIKIPYNPYMNSMTIKNRYIEIIVKLYDSSIQTKVIR
jgi:hypothetical protein